MKKKTLPGKASCASTAGYIYQPWPKGKPVRKAKRRSTKKRR
jgi:hypothetical protein